MKCFVDFCQAKVNKNNEVEGLDEDKNKIKGYVCDIHMRELREGSHHGFSIGIVRGDKK